MFWFKKFVIRCRAIILYEGKLLVVKHTPDANFVALPGGHLEWKEDIKEGLRREIKEELGISPEIGRLLYVNNFIQGKRKQSIEFFFEVINSQDYKDIKDSKAIQTDEIAEMSWAEPTSSVSILPKTLGDDFKSGTIISNEVRYIHSQ